MGWDQWPVSVLTNIMKISGFWPVCKLHFRRHKIGNTVLIMHTTVLFVYFTIFVAFKEYFVLKLLGLNKSSVSHIIVNFGDMMVKICILHIAIFRYRNMTCLTRLSIHHLIVNILIVMAFLLPHVVYVFSANNHIVNASQAVKRTKLTTFSKSNEEAVLWLVSRCLYHLLDMTYTPIYLLLFWSWALRFNFDQLEQKMKKLLNAKEFYCSDSEILTRTHTKIVELFDTVDTLDAGFGFYNTAASFKTTYAIVITIFLQAVDSCLALADVVIALIYNFWGILMLCLCGELLHRGVSILRIIAIPRNGLL